MDTEDNSQRQNLKPTSSSQRTPTSHRPTNTYQIPTIKSNSHSHLFLQLMPIKRFPKLVWVVNHTGFTHKIIQLCLVTVFYITPRCVYCNTDLLYNLESVFPRDPEISPGEEARHGVTRHMVHPTLDTQLPHTRVYPRESCFTLWLFYINYNEQLYIYCRVLRYCYVLILPAVEITLEVSTYRLIYIPAESGFIQDSLQKLLKLITTNLGCGSLIIYFNANKRLSVGSIILPLIPVLPWPISPVSRRPCTTGCVDRLDCSPFYCN